MDKSFEGIQSQLLKPFDVTDVEWRISVTSNDKTTGLAVPYIDARAAMQRLDEVFTPLGWTDKYEKWHANVDADGNLTNSQLCGIGARITFSDNHTEWVWKWDGAEDTDYEAVKGGLSKSFVRCAVKWGIGRYLYSIPKIWVKVKQIGKNSYAVDDSEYNRIRKHLKDNSPRISTSQQQPKDSDLTKNDNAPDKPNTPPSTTPNNTDKVPATPKQIATIRKNKDVLKISEEDIINLSKSEADILIKSVINGSNKQQQTQDNYINNTEVGYINKMINNVAARQGKHPDEILDELKKVFGFSDTNKILKTMSKMIIVDLKKKLVA